MSEQHPTRPSSISRERAEALIIDNPVPYQSCCGTRAGMPHASDCVNLKPAPSTKRCPSCEMLGFHHADCPERTGNDAINPKHYEHRSGIETIRINRCMTFDIGNAFKYILRAGQKDSLIQDLRKARWYLEDAIQYDSDVWNGRYDRAAGEPLLEKLLDYETGHRYAIFNSIRDEDLAQAAYDLDTWLSEVTE